VSQDRPTLKISRKTITISLYKICTFLGLRTSQFNTYTVQKNSSEGASPSDSVVSRWKLTKFLSPYITISKLTRFYTQHAIRTKITIPAISFNTQISSSIRLPSQGTVPRQTRLRQNTCYYLLVVKVSVEHCYFLSSATKQFLLNNVTPFYLRNSMCLTVTFF
jgi:hypothetical protein